MDDTEMNETALLLIDLQNDYFEGGSAPLVGSAQAVAQAAALLGAARDAGVPAVHIQHLSVRPGATFFVPDTPGAEIHRSVAPASGETLIQKNFPNAFRNTTLLEQLRARGVDHLIVAGMMTHMCVDSTVRAAFDSGLRITLAHDACATRDLVNGDTTVPAQTVHDAFIAALNGLFAQARTSDEILGTLETHPSA